MAVINKILTIGVLALLAYLLFKWCKHTINKYIHAYQARYHRKLANDRQDDQQAHSEDVKSNPSASPLFKPSKDYTEEQNTVLNMIERFLYHVWHTTEKMPTHYRLQLLLPMLNTLMLYVHTEPTLERLLKRLQKHPMLTPDVKYMILTRFLPSMIHIMPTPLLHVIQQSLSHTPTSSRVIEKTMTPLTAKVVPAITPSHTASSDITHPAFLPAFLLVFSHNRHYFSDPVTLSVLLNMIKNFIQQHNHDHDNHHNHDYDYLKNISRR
jgi:hypothetical protein